MKTLTLIWSFFILTHCFAFNEKQKLALKTTKYQVITKETNIKSEANNQSTIIGMLSENDIVNVIEFTSKEDTLSIRNAPSFKSKWAKVITNKNEIGYVFGAMLQLASLNDYSCIKPVKSLNIKAKGEGIYIKLCSDGSYTLSEYYNCDGYVCSEHGCWNSNRKSLKLSPRKIFYYSGVGEAENCTHGCTYSEYNPNSESSNSQSYDTNSIYSFKGLDFYNIESNSGDLEITDLPQGYNCKYNTLF
ncbi:SH3 domain-containing protein [Leptospira interrogans]|uniref:SH3 domain-containing protein n=1 Tax=Leptospira interrogans TaxID=173 RepID=UPI0002984255|nr:SH3 domain-containing protein [Leptospira interrogans]EKR24610.1 hypothetical protein LEP1GSC087_0013 [Leptospira interrogans serovar Bataviae str. L1111]ULG94499.1 SH3 domain-containing protein [Leptospira interrogans]